MLFGQNSLTTQLVNLGMIEKALGFCYLPPARNAQCDAAPISNASRIVLGFGPMPNEIAAAGGLEAMQNAPLLNITYPPPPVGATEPTFPEFRTQAAYVNMLDISGNASKVDVSAANILW